MNITVKILLRKDYQKNDGSQPIYLRVTFKSKPVYFSLNVSTPVKYWRVKGNSGYVTKSMINYQYINMIIDRSYNRANQIIYDFEKDSKYLSIDMFKHHFNNDKYGSKSFYDFANNKLLEYRDKARKGEFSDGTIRGYESQIVKLKEYRPLLTFAEIDVRFLDNYGKFLSTEKENNSNTIKRSYNFIKSIVNKAIQENIIDENQNAFKNYKIGQIEGNREVLDIKEVDYLHWMLDNGKFSKGHSNVISYFLFSIYTGLRFGDIKRIRFKDVKTGLIDGEISKYLRIKTQKTDELINVPIIPRAEKLIGCGFDNQNLFKILTEPSTNRSLKKIMIQAEINKYITYHCSRHTFGTLGIEFGIPLVIVSKMMGHKKIETTMGYLKVSDPVRHKEMKKWG